MGDALVRDGGVAVGLGEVGVDRVRVHPRGRQDRREFGRPQRSRTRGQCVFGGGVDVFAAACPGVFEPVEAATVGTGGMQQ